MGRSYTPKYRVEHGDQTGRQMPSAWRVTDYGAPTAHRLAVWVNRMEDSYKLGRCNAHIALRLGFLPSIHYACIVNQRTGTVVAEYKAPAFKLV